MRHIQIYLNIAKFGIYILFRDPFFRLLFMTKITDFNFLSN